jgi:hypothetical protein
MASFKEIKLTQGKTAIVDAEDFDFLNQFKWYYHNGYARAKIGGKQILMHRLLLQAGPNDILDHINGNGLDNRKENLRFANKTFNKANEKLRGDNKTGFKGVYMKKDSPYRHKKWAAKIGFMGHQIHIGYFYNKEEAARAYNEMARKLFGEFALLNQIERG